MMDWNTLSEGFQELNCITIMVRLGLAMLVGAVLGIERGYKNRPAGFRTYALVCIGSTVIMMTNQYIYQATGIGDPARLGAQVVSGIGFLGAGTIIITRGNAVKGLTTAAGLWVAGCLGLAIGIGFYSAAVIGLLSVFCIMVMLHHMDDGIKQRSKIINVYLEYDSTMRIRVLMQAIRAKDCSVFDLQLGTHASGDTDTACITFSIKLKKYVEHDIILDMLNDMDGIIYAAEV